MKKKISVPMQLFFTAAGAGLVFVLFSFGAPILPKAFDILFNRWGNPLRIHIAQLGTLFLIAGIIGLIIRNAAGKPLSRPEEPPMTHEPHNFSVQNLKSPNPAWILGALACPIFFIMTPFAWAFTFTAGFVSAALLKLKRNRAALTASSLLIVLLFWSAYLFRGDRVHTKIFDNLDCHIPQSIALAASGKAFSLNSDSKLDQIANGLPLCSIDSGFNVLTWLLMLFPPLTAYAINELVMRLFAFFGMMLLLRKHLLKSENHEKDWIATGAALCFSLLPFYPAGGLSIAGFPLLLHAFLMIRQQEGRLRHYLFMAAFPFYSKLALSGIFIILFFAVFSLVDWSRTRRFPYKTAAAAGLLAAFYGLTQYHLIHAFLDSNYVSFRREISFQGKSFLLSFRDSLHNLTFDRVNVAGAQQLFIIPAAALAVLISLFKKVKIKLLVLLVTAALAAAFMNGFQYWRVFQPVRESLYMLNAFDFSRFYWFNPVLWAIIFASALHGLRKYKFGSRIISFFTISQILFMFSFYNWEYRYQLGIKRSPAGSPLTYSLTFGEFYSETLFQEIERAIGKPKSGFRTVCLGIHPGIASYNGFYTLDVYTDYYPLEYKKQFRRIIEREMEKDEGLRRAYDSNAKRCYMMVSELHGNDALRGLAFTRGITKYDQHVKIRSLDLNTEALKQMGGRYIFSGVEILNFEENGLVLDGVFENQDSPWKIFLYRVL